MEILPPRQDSIKAPEHPCSRYNVAPCLLAVLYHFNSALDSDTAFPALRTQTWDSPL